MSNNKESRTQLISHVSRKGFEEVNILIHGAINIPNIENRPAKAYVTGQSTYTLVTQEIGEKPNATNPIDGPDPTWNEIIFVETVDEKVENEELVILIIDEPQNKNIAEYRIPWKWLQPFYEYHFEMTLPQKESMNELKLYCSILRKKNVLSEESFKYFGLEVMMNQFDILLSDKQSLYAVGRVVPNYKYYKSNFLRQDTASVEVTRVPFPAPSYNYFIPKEYDMEGFPQVTLATRNEKKQNWQHNFLFSLPEEKDAMFNNDAALVIEFYPFKRLHKQPWSLKDLFGWVSIKLDQRTYEALDSGMSGLKTDGLIVEANEFIDNVENKQLTAEVFMRLIQQKNPKATLKNTHSIPVLNSYNSEENMKNGIEPVYLQTQKLDKNKDKPNKFKNDQNFQEQYIKVLKQEPNVNSYNEIVSRKGKLKPNIEKLPIILPQEDLNDIPIEYRSYFFDNSEPLNNNFTDYIRYYQDLLRSYNFIVRKMVEDIRVLKQHLKNIEISNNDLRLKIGGFENKKLALLKLAQLNEMDKSRLNEIFVDLRMKLAVKSSELIEIREQNSLLKRELDKKQAIDLEYQKLINAHKLQNNQIQTLQKRLAIALETEDTCRRQEIVIERLEDLIRRILRDNSKTNTGKYQNDDIGNLRLVEELDEIKRSKPDTFYKSEITENMDIANQRLKRFTIKD